MLVGGVPVLLLIKLLIAMRDEWAKLHAKLIVCHTAPSDGYLLDRAVKLCALRQLQARSKLGNGRNFGLEAGANTGRVQNEEKS